MMPYSKSLRGLEVSNQQLHTRSWYVTPVLKPGHSRNE